MFTKAPSVCSSEMSTQTYPFDPLGFADETIEHETLVGFMAQTSLCTCGRDRHRHVQVDGWIVVTDKGMYEVDNSGLVYRSRTIHPFVRETV